MPKKGKTRPAGGTARRAEETAATTNDQKFSRSHNTTSQERVQAGFISQFLLAGAGQGLHLRDLVKLTGRTEREVRQMIQAERLRGIPKFSRARVLPISFSALRSRSSRVFSSPSSRVVSLSSHCSARSIASARTEPGVMSCSLGVIFPKYSSSSVFRMCVASFATTQHITEKRNSQGHGAELSNNSHFPVSALCFVKRRIFRLRGELLSLFHAV